MEVPIDGPSLAGLQPIVSTFELAWFYVDLLLDLHQGSGPKVEQLVLLSLAEGVDGDQLPISAVLRSTPIPYHTQ